MKNIWRHFLLATLVSLGITVFLASMYYSNSSGEESLGAHIMSSSALIGFILSMLLYFTNYVVHLLVEKLLIYTGVAQAHRTYGIQQIAFIGTGVVVSIVFYYIYLSLLLHVFYKVSFREFYSGSNFTLRGMLYVALIALFVLLIVFAFTSYVKLKNLAIRNEQIEVALRKAEIASLKEQISPHFLFNNLNVLIGTIQEDPPKAEQFVRSFIAIYRYVLEQIDSGRAKVEDEMRFVRAYMYLINVRYESAIDLKIDERVEAWYSCEIVSLSMQVLVENIVKHNAIPPHQKLLVKVEVENGEFLVISNEKFFKNQSVYSTRLGLKNLNTRYQLESGKNIVVEETVEEYKVKLPILKKKECV